MEFNVFSGGQLSQVLGQNLSDIKNSINAHEEGYLLNVNEQEYIEHLISEHQIDPPVLHADKKYLTETKRFIPAEHFPGRGFSYNVEQGQEYQKQVFTCHVPVSGNHRMLNYIPNPYIAWGFPNTIIEKEGDGFSLLFEVINFSDNGEEIKKQIENQLSNIQAQTNHIVNQIEQFNQSLPDSIKAFIAERKSTISKNNQLIETIGIPIKKKDEIPSTFVIPAPAIPKKIIPVPTVLSNKQKPDPTIELKDYEEILKVIHDVGKQMERTPSVYLGKDEEQLRDYFLMFLQPNFGGSATGETFNKKGKTDILLRYENSNIFVAECKFWKGDSAFSNCIDQLLGYLTWRDSKTAIVLFVKNKDMTNVLESAKSVTKSHKNYLQEDGQKDSTWLSYKFHFDGDDKKEIYLTVLAFHLPD